MLWQRSTTALLRAHRIRYISDHPTPRSISTSRTAKMRLPYTDNPPQFSNEEDKETLKMVQARRGANGLIPLDLALLHAPKIAHGKS